MVTMALINLGPSSIQKLGKPTKHDLQELNQHLVPSLAQKTSFSSSSSSHGSKGGEFITGLFIICIALPLVWFNEKKQVKIYKLLSAGKKAVVQNVSINEVRKENNLKLIHAQGLMTTDAPISDERFSISCENTVKLQRVVEMYQWIQTVRTHEHQRTYSYRKDFVSTHIDSAQFNDQEKNKNP